MIKNSSYQSKNSRQNKSPTPIPLQTQPFPWAGGQDNDWNLSDSLDILQRRWLILTGVAATVMTLATIYTLNQKAVFEGNFRLLVESVTNYENSLSKLTSAMESGADKSSLDYESQIEVLKSPELMKEIVKDLQVSYPEVDYGSLMSSLGIARLGETKIIEIRYQNENPEKIKVVLDKIADTYLKYSLEKRQTKLRQGVQFVNREMPSVKNQVNKLQKELQNFRQKYQFFDPTSQSEQVSKQIQTLKEQQLDIDRQLATARANFNILKGKEGALAILKDAPVYQQLIVQQRQLETQIAYELTRFQEDSPSIQSLREKRENLLPLIQQEANQVLNSRFAEATIQIQTLEVQNQELAKAEQELNQLINQLPSLARRYTELQQNLQISTETLNRFLLTRQTLQVEAAQTELPWELIRASVKPQFPISPNISRSLTLGLVASSFLGIGAALIFEKLDNTYHSAETFRDKVKLPFLGTIPFDKDIQNTQSNSKEEASQPEKQALLRKEVSKLPRSAKKHKSKSKSYHYYTQGQFLESIWILYTNIQLLASDRPIRSLVISSAEPGDGKSLVAYHLAEIAATMGQRVLLVDADMRRPQIHNRIGLNNLWGLSSLISTNIEVDQVIQQAPSASNLSIVTSGPLAPDPAKLLSSEKMKKIMTNFYNDFDLVIYDAPPLLGLADATLLAAQTDGLIFLARLHKTNRSAVKEALSRLKGSQINILGVLVNAAKNTLGNYKY
jgi:polysaccharide biosynthesis transport protein